MYARKLRQGHYNIVTDDGGKNDDDDLNDDRL